MWLEYKKLVILIIFKALKGSLDLLQFISYGDKLANK